MKKSLWQVIVAVLVSSAPLSSYASSVVIQDGFGANLHLHQRIPASDWGTVMQQAEDTGVQWGREQFNWDVIEPVDNSYDWTKYDAVVQTYQAHHIQMLGLLTYSSIWAADSETTPPDLIAWQDYVGTVAEHYKDSVTYWEIWNEPNHPGFWNSDVDTYTQYLAAAATAIKTKNPNAKIVLGGLSGADGDFLSQIYDNLDDPDSIDVVAIHPYRLVGDNFNYAPEQTIDGLNTLVTDLYNIKAISQRYQKRVVPIWLTEVGWSTASAGVTEAQQAEYLKRLYTIAFSVPDIQKVFWYSFTNTSSDTNTHDDHFGLYTFTYQPKPAATAYQLMFNQLNDTTSLSRGLVKTRLFDNFSTEQGWHFSGNQCSDGRVGYHPKDRLVISYSFDASNCYGTVILNKSLPRNTRALQFMLKGNNDTTVLRFRIIDHTGETFQYNLGYMPAQWLRYTIQLKQFANHWGGNNDGRIDQPITTTTLVFDHPNGGATTTRNVQLDDLATTTRANRYRYRFTTNDQSYFARWNATKLNYYWR